MHVLCHASRDDESVSAIVPLATENDDATWAIDGPLCEEIVYAVAYVATGVFHELQAGNAMVLDGEPVNFAHFGCGECFHRRKEMRLQHPAAADVYNLAGDVLRFFGREKRNGSRDVLDRRRTANGKPRVSDAAGFVKS